MLRPESVNISTIRGGDEQAQAYGSGTLAGAGSFRCDSCGYAIALQELDELPDCPHCHGGRFRRSSIFAGTVVEPQGGHEVESPDWLDDVRATLSSDGVYMAWEEGGVHVFPVEEGWTRIGRSLAADVRFDDPTVSRRHALIHRGEGKSRVLDDRSLNGVFLNGERVEWHELQNGDEIAIGRFRMYFICPSASGLEASAAAAEEAIT